MIIDNRAYVDASFPPRTFSEWLKIIKHLKKLSDDGFFVNPVRNVNPPSFIYN